MIVQEEIADVYPYEFVEDRETGNVGSCSTYYSRSNITSQIRDGSFSPKLTYDEVIEK